MDHMRLCLDAETAGLVNKFVLFAGTIRTLREKLITSYQHLGLIYLQQKITWTTWYMLFTNLQTNIMLLTLFWIECTLFATYIIEEPKEDNSCEVKLFRIEPRNKNGHYVK